MIASENALQLNPITWASLPRKLQKLIVALAAMAVAILCWSSWRFTAYMPTDNGWTVLAALGIITVPFFVYLPRIESIVLVGETYYMAIAMLYGPAACVVLTAIYALLFFLISRTFKPCLIAFGFSVIVCDACLYSIIFQILSPATAYDLKSCLLPAAIMAFVSFLFTSLAAAMTVSWRHGKKMPVLWIKSYPPLLLNSFILRRQKSVAAL